MLLWSQFIYYNYIYNRIYLQLPPSTTSINSLASGNGDGEESQQLLGNKTRTCVVGGLGWRAGGLGWWGWAGGLGQQQRLGVLPCG